MKARVKATGEIVDVSPYWTEIHTTNGGCYEMTEVDLIYDAPDYWTCLEHQYAGMAMQGIMNNPIGFENIRARGRNIQIETALLASEFAHALVEKLKSEEKK